MRFKIGVLLLFLPALVLSYTITTNVDEVSFIKSNGYDIPLIEEYGNTSTVGAPMLPVKTVTLALPNGMTIEDVEVTYSEPYELPGEYEIFPVQEARPISEWDEDYEFVEPNMEYYGISGEYPGDLIGDFNGIHMGGYSLANIEFYPLQYEPTTGKLTLYQTIEYDLTLGAEDADNVKPKYRSIKVEEQWRELIKKMIDNPEEVGYSGAQLIDTTIHNPDIPDMVEYLIIIGDSDLESTAQEFADWKTKMGHKAEVVTTDWIENNYSGVDDMEQYRNCIIDYYENNGLVYVLLIGSIGDINCRDTYDQDFYVDGHYGGYVPTEMYYACLDGTWNDDGDNYWGEYPSDDPDFGYEVFLGRWNVDTVSELEDVMDKTYIYEGSELASEDSPFDYEEEILFMAGVLWWYPFTDSGVTKDWIESNYYSSWGNIIKLYEYDYSNFTRANVINELNEGKNLDNHIHHCGTHSLGTQGAGVSSDDLYDLENGPRFSGNFYTVGCYACNIDYSNNCGSMFVKSPDGGGVNFIGNTRYGFGTPGNPMGDRSLGFDRDFHRELIDNNITVVGETLVAHKADKNPETDWPYHLYIIYELYLQGDPSLDIWTGNITSDNLNVTHPDSESEGNQDITVSVEKDGTPLEDALVCIWQEGYEYVYGRTDSNGEITFNVDFVDGVNASVTVSAHNSDTYEGIIDLGGSSDIELAKFNAIYTEDGVELTWDVISDEEIEGFNLYRKEGGIGDLNLIDNGDKALKERMSDSLTGDDWELVNDGLIVGENPYKYLDVEIVDEGLYSYRLEAVVEENVEILGTVIPTGGIPTSFELKGIYPNPTSGIATIEYSLAETTDVEIEMYDITGRVVKSMSSVDEGAGEHCMDLNVSELQSGVYILKMTAGDFVGVERIAVVK